MTRAAALAFAAATALGGCASIANTVFFHPEPNAQPLVLPDGTRELRTVTADGVDLQLFHVTRGRADRCVVYFHGNAGTAAHRIPAAELIAANAHADVLLVEYRGYGESGGSPSEAGVYLDARAALRFAEEELGFAPDRIVVLGRSLGSAVAVELLTEAAVAGVILVTPFTSGRDMACALGWGWAGWMMGRPFETLERVPGMSEPLLVVHGTADDIIPIEQGRRIFDAAPGRRRFLSVAGGGHNDELTDYGRLAEFIAEVTAGR